MHTRLFHRPLAFVLSALAAVLLALGAPSAAFAQAGQGAVEGVARGAEEGSPLSFALIRLLPVRTGAAVPEAVVTDAEGRFRFAAVPAGEYRLQLDQIGYERTLSAVVRVQAGATLRQEIRSTMRPVQLESLTVRAGQCLTAAQLGDDPELAALWNEAKKGVEARRAFGMQYRFTRILRQDVEERWRVRGTRRVHMEDTIVNEPDSVVVREVRRRAQQRAEGYASEGRLILPPETDLLDDDFLRDHCLETSFEEEDGAFALRFRPLQARRSGVGIRGTIRVDAGTYAIRRLEFEYLRDGRPFAETSVDYADVAVAGSTLRLPDRGRASVRPGGVGRALLARVNATYTFHLQDVRPVGPR